MNTPLTQKIALLATAAIVLVSAGTMQASSDITTTWTGKISSDWNESGNWSSGTPFISGNAIIPEMTSANTKYPSINGRASCKNLTLASGAKLAMGQKGEMTLAGDWILEGSFDCGKGTVIFAGSTVIIAESITLNNVDIVGTMVAPGGQMEIMGYWNNSGTFVHNEGTINFIGTTNVTGSTNTEFNNLMINGALITNLTMYVEGNWTNYGDFDAGRSTVAFTGWESQSIEGNTIFNNIEIDNTGKGINLKGSQMANNMILKKGYENMYTSNYKVLLNNNSASLKNKE